jgi:hypothetical protein
LKTIVFFLCGCVPESKQLRKEKAPETERKKVAAAAATNPVLCPINTQNSLSSHEE